MLVIDTSFKAFCHDVVLFLTSLVHHRMFLNFLYPFFFIEKSFGILLMFHFGTALFITGGGYLPFLEKISEIFFRRR